MGLERVAAVLQGKLSNYETDLIAPIVGKVAELLNVTPGGNAQHDAALRIAADHARATAFLIHDGVLPANDGRGYVLRKIMRRALRHARRAGAHEPFLYKVTGFVAEWMQPAYPELMESVQRVARVVKDEEHRYATTFQVAEKVFHDEAKAAAGGVLPGAASFKLYDTYGLAVDEQEEMAREYGIAIDHEGFRKEMEAQRARARASWKGAERAQVDPVYQRLAEGSRTEFLGHEHLDSAATVRAVLKDSTELVLDRTPFYAETGGQVGDQGVIYAAETGEKLAGVEDAWYPVPGLVVHKIRPVGKLAEGMPVRAVVGAARREAIMRNHTATHLLHAALRHVLGTHVKQAGSVVEPARLRFDFTHYAALDPEELAEVERLINQHVLRNITVLTNLMDLDQALTTGAMALFGEKYGERVRVVTIPEFSRELCGGTHVRQTGDIGLCKIVSEGSISAGVRRIEAVTGEGALERFRAASDTLAQAASLVRGSEHDVVEAIQRLLAQNKALERQVDQLKQKLAGSEAASLEDQAREVKGIKVLAARVDDLDRAQMRNLADSLRNKWKSCVVVLASARNGTIAIVSAVTKDLAGKVHAGKLAGALAQAVGGKGGGRPDMAEAGGKDAAALPAALESVYASVESML